MADTKKTVEISEDFTGSEVNDNDLLAMQLFVTPEGNIKIETGVVVDEDGNELPARKAMENTLTILRTALFTLSEEYIRVYGAELENEDAPFFDITN